MQLSQLRAQAQASAKAIRGRQAVVPMAVAQRPKARWGSKPGSTQVDCFSIGALSDSTTPPILLQAGASARSAAAGAAGSAQRASTKAQVKG